jgi:hypothetical protein
MSVPSSILPPLGRRLTLVWIGTERPSSLNAARAEDGGLHLEDVLRGLDDDQVDATRDQAGGLFGEHLDELGEGDLAERRVVGGGEVAGGADRARDEALLADGLAGDLGGADVDLARVLAQPPFVELEAAGLERVGLDDLGARLDHRRVHAFDDVGPVEHERLVGAAGELVVVLERQVELLECRAHAAVEHDDALARGCQEIAHRSGKPIATLTRPCQPTGAGRRILLTEDPEPSAWGT